MLPRDVLSLWGKLMPGRPRRQAQSTSEACQTVSRRRTSIQLRCFGKTRLDSLAGVRIFEYQNGGQEIRLDSPIDKLIMSVSNFAAELEQAKASQRTRDALKVKAPRGYVVGKRRVRLTQRPRTRRKRSA